MKQRRVPAWRAFLYFRLIWLLLGFAVLAVAGYVWLSADIGRALASARDNLVENEGKTRLAQKAAQIEHVFDAMYQNARTISLLPSVRDIHGANRVNEDEDILKQQRFSPDAFHTVQQVFNNLSSNVSVSEIYAVLDGLDAAKGQVPFFMFDTVRLNTQLMAADPVQMKTADTPEESEDEEYAYFPKQIAQLKASHPQFTFRELGDIPAATSPLMRTCDNTQYYAKSVCNVYDASGILYSVPFYNRDNQLSGVISVIVRANVFEAVLLDVPFLVLTPRDKVAAKTAGFAMPAAAAQFALVNAQRGIRIMDRRNAQLLAIVQSGSTADGSVLLQQPLKVHSDSPWQLYYHVSAADIAARQAPLLAAYHDKLLAFSALWGTCLLFGLFVVYRQYLTFKQLYDLRRIERTITQVAASFDLTLRIDGLCSPQTREAATALNTLLAAWQSNMLSVERDLDNALQASASMQQAAGQLSRLATEGDCDTRSIDTELVQLSQAMLDIQQRSGEARSLSQQSVDVASSNSEVILRTQADIQSVSSSAQQTADCLHELQRSSRDITQIVAVIESLAAQTNLLALGRPWLCRGGRRGTQAGR